MKLAVILPAYNAENFITECLDSLLNQTFSDFCILAVNDASTDNTGNILETYAAKDTRLRVYHFSKNQGEPAVMQFAMDMLNYMNVECVARMDADDICVPHRFEKQIQYLDEHPEIDILGSNALLFNDGQTDKMTKVSTLPLLDKDIKAHFSLARDNIINPSSMWRHSSIKALGINYAQTATAPDFYMWVQCALHQKKFANLPEPLLLYRLHPGQESKKQEKISEAVQYSMELWISHLFPELTPKEVSLLSLILHGKTIKLRTEEFDIAFSAYDKVRSNDGNSLFGEDRETMFSILDRHTQALKKVFYKHIS
nr:glycosyltransferase [uncultured Haemophilus sp.]